ncbi:MAG: alpha-L-arabinofuranosidase C-terminal domain-containing protein [Rhizomicrobium sp.]
MNEDKRDMALPTYAEPRRRTILGALAGAGLMAVLPAREGPAAELNAPHEYPKRTSGRILECVVDAGVRMGPVDSRLFGTNLEWFNEGGGFINADPEFSAKLICLAREQGVTVFRFPGGTLADYYHWIDGTGPCAARPVRRHPTDSGQSPNHFGTPEFFELLRATGAQGLITVNAGTGTASEAAQWVAYANEAKNARRQADGFKQPVGIKLWEIGNELYLPGNPHEQKITVTPEVYVGRFREFASAMRHVDPTIEVIAIGVAKSHSGPGTQFPEWTETLLQRAAGDIDMIAVHNSYFPVLYRVGRPPIEEVYRALWAAPEAVDRSLTALEELIGRYERGRQIGIAVTEWGALFSLPSFDPYWVDHVKTLGSGVYVARLLQVFMSHPRVKMTNYFKLVDRSFMGWINYAGDPKVPYWVFQLYAKYSGDQRLRATVQTPTYDVGALGIMDAEAKVPEVTVLATRRSFDGSVYVNFVNRSMTTTHRVHLNWRGFSPQRTEILMITGDEPTANNGRDIPPEWQYNKAYEPYTTAAPNSIRISRKISPARDIVDIPPFSIVTFAGLSTCLAA